MTHLERLRAEWFPNVRADILAGTVVALALIPEAIAFSIIAGVDPKMGLYASFCIMIVIAFAGGRPAMISAATGAMALVMVTLVRDHGPQYLLAATLLCGVFQIIAGVLKLSVLMRFVSRSVMTGFVNALAILIFMAQLPELIGVNWITYPMVAVGLAIIYILPRFTTAVPSPLVAIVFLTAAALLFGIEVRTVGDMGELPTDLPAFLLPDVPWNLETLRIILPTSLTLAVVGLLESFMTAQIVDELTDTPSNKNREGAGQGLSNIVAGCFGGMAGCAMIGQSVINVQSGGRGRLSTLWGGVFLLILLMLLGDLVRQIPMAALVAVMVMVSIGTFRWSSLRDLAVHPWESSVVMVATVIVTVLTHDLAQGVAVGVLLSGIFFARKAARIFRITSTLSEDGRSRTYTVTGEIFFASADAFVDSFDLREAIERAVIDVSGAHVWDLTAVAAIDRVVLKFRREGTEVDILGLNQASSELLGRLGRHDKPGATDAPATH